MDPYAMNHGVLSPNGGQAPVSPPEVKLENNMESSFNLEGCISQMMQHHPSVSPPPSIKPVTTTGKISTLHARTSTTACFMGDYDIHPSHVKKKGLEGNHQLTISLPEENTVSLKKECFLPVDSRVSSTDIANELTLIADPCTKADDPRSLNVQADNTIEGVGLVVDPQMTNLPEALKKVDKVIIVCDKSKLNSMFNTKAQEQPIVSHPQDVGHRLMNAVDGQVIIGAASDIAGFQVVEEATVQQQPAECEVFSSIMTEAVLGQDYLAPSRLNSVHPSSQIVLQPSVQPSSQMVLQPSSQVVLQPSSQIDLQQSSQMDLQQSSQTIVSSGTSRAFAESVETKESFKLVGKPVLCDQELETVDFTDVLGIKEEPAAVITFEQLKGIVAQPDANNLLQPEVAAPSTSIGRPLLLEMPTPHMKSQLSTLNTPDLLGDDGSFDLLEYITKEENIAEEHVEPSTSCPFQFPVVDSKPPNQRKRKLVTIEGTTKKPKIQVTVKKPAKSYRKPAPKTSPKKKVMAVEKQDETRIKNNIASKRSRDNRKMKQMENERLLVELSEKNQELMKKHATLQNLVNTMQNLMFNCMAKR